MCWCNKRTSLKAARAESFPCATLVLKAASNNANILVIDMILSEKHYKCQKKHAYLR